LDVGGIRGCNVRFGHQERRADLALEQRLEPRAFLFLGAVAFQRFHIAGVGRVAVEDLRGPSTTASMTFTRSNSRMLMLIIPPLVLTTMDSCERVTSRPA